jgi:CheY-like chemotaxis protein
MSAQPRVLVVDDSATILKVVSAILSRHGFEPSAARDGMAGIEMIKRGPRFDLVLLDFVMPRMNGYQFCRELRSSPEHRSLPVVLMSAKGDKIRGHFVQQTGAVDAITKPFDARALVAVVEGALAKAVEGRARPVPEGRGMPDEDTLADSPSRSPESMAPAHRQQRAAIQLAQQVATAVVPAIASLPVADRASEAGLLAAVARAMTSEVLHALAHSLRGLDHHGDADGAKEVMSGDISAIPLAEILQVLQMQRQTGVLRVTTPRAGITLWIRQGLVDLVQSRGAADEFRLGRYFVERGLTTREQIDAVLRSSAADGILLGEALVRAGAIGPKDLSEALGRQSSELVYDMLRWPAGRFSFTQEAFRPEADAAKLGLGISALVLEGFRRVDEWRLMEGVIDFDRVVVVDAMALDGVGTDKLTRAERLVLDAVDGSRTVSQVVKESLVGSFDALKVIYQFLQSRVLRTRAS